MSGATWLAGCLMPGTTWLAGCLMPGTTGLAGSLMPGTIWLDARRRSLTNSRGAGAFVRRGVVLAGGVTRGRRVGLLHGRQRFSGTASVQTFDRILCAFVLRHAIAEVAHEIRRFYWRGGQDKRVRELFADGENVVVIIRILKNICETASDAVTLSGSSLLRWKR